MEGGDYVFCSVLSLPRARLPWSLVTVVRHAGPVTRVENLMMDEIVSSVHVKVSSGVFVTAYAICLQHDLCSACLRAGYAKREYCRQARDVPGPAQRR